MGDRPTPAEMAHAEAAAALTDLNVGIVRAAFPPGSAHEELFDLLVADRAALLDMVDGYQQLVREFAYGRIDGTETGRRPDLFSGGGWQPLADVRPDLAALLDQALTPQGDPT